MSWWNRFSGHKPPRAVDARLVKVVMPMQGWMEGEPDDDMRVWRNVEQDVLSLAAGSFPLRLGQASDESVLRVFARELAEGRHDGLIEVRRFPHLHDAAVSLIYKRLVMPMYVFQGMLFLPMEDWTQLWTIVAGERGTTGVREAVVTAQLMEAGSLTVESYARSWACDPYDPAYSGVDRSVLRFISDDERYDEQFPEHPLTRVRRVQAYLRSRLWPE